MFCNQCGEKNSDDCAFCVYCGYHIAGQLPAVDDRSSTPDNSGELNKPAVFTLPEYNYSTPIGYCSVCGNQKANRNASINNIQMKLCVGCFNDVRSLVDQSKYNEAAFENESDRFLQKNYYATNAKYITEYLRAKNIDKTITDTTTTSPDTGETHALLPYDYSVEKGHCAMCRQANATRNANINNIQMDLCDNCFNDVRSFISCAKNNKNAFANRNKQFLQRNGYSTNAVFISEYIKAKFIDHSIPDDTLPKPIPSNNSSVMSIGDYLSMLIISDIPVIGLIAWFTWVFSPNTNPNKKNYLYAILALKVIRIIVAIILYCARDAVIEMLWNNLF